MSRPPARRSSGADSLCNTAGIAGVQGMPLFMFQEGRDSTVERTFRSMARLSGGAYAHFDHSSPQQLSQLLGAVARYASSGKQGLLEYGQAGGENVKLLLDQLK